MSTFKQAFNRALALSRSGRLNYFVIFDRDLADGGSPESRCYSVVEENIAGPWGVEDHDIQAYVTPDFSEVF